jgi:hypothetical protein
MENRDILRYARSTTSYGVGVAVGYRGLTAIDIETDNNEIFADLSCLQAPSRSRGAEGAPILGRRKIGYPRGARREWLRTRMFNYTAEARLTLNEQGS